MQEGVVVHNSSTLSGFNESLRYRSLTFSCFHRQLWTNLSSTSLLSCTANFQALPVELLTYIFTFCVEESNNIHPRYPAWLPVTHVCHRWRTIALGHAPLWTSVPSGLPLRWIKAFMERSRIMLIDLDICVDPDGWSDQPNSLVLHPRDIVLLLADFTRVRSLRLTGTHDIIHPIVNSLRNSLPIQSLSIRLLGPRIDLVLPEDLFGGKVSIRHLQFASVYCRIVAPIWLLRSVTHFTITEPMSSKLVGILHQMSALIRLEISLGYGYRGESYPDESRISPIPLPHLKNLIVRPLGPCDFLRLNHILSLPAGVKRQLELSAPETLYDWVLDDDFLEGVSTLVETANGFQHIHFSGERKEGSFRMWTGPTDTPWEDAEFCLSAKWRDPHDRRISSNHLIAFCDLLDEARARRLVIDSPSSGMLKTYWWKLLKGLPGIEELELSSTSADALDDAWKANTGPSVLPALRRVWIGSLQYAIIGDTPPRRIVRLASDDVTLLEGSAENEVELMSSGLLRLLQGWGRSRELDSKKRKGKKARRVQVQFLR